MRIRRESAAEETLVLRGQAVTLGRAASNTIVIDNTLASRNHARIEPEGSGYTLTDCGSKNGTLVNGTMTERRVLSDGDVIEVGTTSIWFCQVEQEATDATPEVEVLDYAEPGGVEALARFAAMIASIECEVSSLGRVAGEITTLITCNRATIMLTGAGRPTQFSRAATEDERSDGPDDAVIHAALTIERPLCIAIPRTPVIGATLGARRHLLLMPLTARGEKLGLLALERAPNLPPFEDADLLYISIASHHVTTFLLSLR